MNPLQRFRMWIGRTAMKAAGLTFVPQWLRHSFMSVAWDVLLKQGLKGNATAYACAVLLARTFPEPELWAWQTTAEGEYEKIANHPLRALMGKPNGDTGEAELLAFCVVYAAVGGNAYLWKQRNNAGQVVGFWPFHDGDMQPIPGITTEEGLTAYYVLDIGDGSTGNPFGVNRHDNVVGIAIPKADVIHWKWMIDPEQPWRGIGALEASINDSQVANEIRAYIYSLLKNDAKPPIVINLAEGEEYDEDKAERLRVQWLQRYGGSNRGTPAFLEFGMNVKELGFNLQQLEIDSLRDGPDAAICMGFGIHPAVIGALVGLKHSTYSNFEEARRALTEQTLIPLWRAFASEMEQAMRDEKGYGAAVRIRFDIAQVRALLENQTAVREFALNAFNAGLVTRAAALQMLGMKTGPGDEVYKVGLTTTFLPAGQAVTLPVTAATGGKGPVLWQRSDGEQNGNGYPQHRNGVKAEDYSDSVMVALFPPPEIARQLAALGGWPDGSTATTADEMHLTLSFLGSTASVKEGVLAATVQRFAENWQSLKGAINGYGRFTNIHIEGMDAVYATFDCKQLPEFRQALVAALASAGIVSPSEHGFVPHITLAYIPSAAATPPLSIPALEFEFDTVMTAYGNHLLRFELRGEKAGRNGRKAAPDPDKFFDYGFASRLKEEWPEIWAAGGNERGNETFQLWARWREGERTEAIEYWIETERPAWGARHHENFQLAGVVAQIKWGWVGSRGEDYMKGVIRDEIERLSEKANPDPYLKAFPQGNGGARVTAAPVAQIQRQQTAVARLRDVREALLPKAETAVARYFSDYAGRAAAVLEAEKSLVLAGNGRAQAKQLTQADVSRLYALLYAQENAESLLGVIEEIQLAVALESWGVLNLLVDSAGEFNRSDIAVIQLLQTAGQRVTNITDSTRQMLQTRLQQSYTAGWSINDVVNGRSGLPGIKEFIAETYQGRNRTIARTEIGTAQQRVAVGRYRTAGADGVIVFDDGFENSHPTCQELDGTVQTLEWAAANPLQHPNCVRAFGAWFRE